ncbi:hypothetical protein DI09_25p130 [Mitosporidium daphniae]|uniref:Complex 1 LYR protein domain-containing protein n=1 Tax=Mitosporidium daphniae TaxID=1485682 RepID=A0A098VS37_9MICR|nr:uncharacterized protein DI09_25p130 [Mitosporidium daphniae]KGG51853.1 hypothetical protein DI09_25p130 [Mitosporidium daphniae]|eukprot:XP_013238280.1 uncharacterized protein DI09_25p130 [Mitosporidium daphniae]
MAYSGLQLKVLAFAREALRACGKRGDPVLRERFRAYVMGEFRANSRRVSKSDFATIEYMLRIGRKRLDNMLSDPSVTAVHFKHLGGG